jgi:hypothetical protein
MRSLQYDLGKRSPLFFDFNAGVSFNPSAYTALDFNKTPVTAPITENPFLTSSAVAPIYNTPAADLFTTFGNSVISPNSWTSADSANAWAGLGAFGTDANTSLSFGADGNLDLSGKPLNVYDRAREQNIEAEKRTAELNAKQQVANAENTEKLLAMFTRLIQMGAKAFSGSGTA